MLVVNCAFAVISVLVVSLRLYARALSQESLFVEEWLILAALVSPFKVPDLIYLFLPTVIGFCIDQFWL